MNPKKKRNPTDITLRNNNARKKEIAALEHKLILLQSRVEYLELYMFVDSQAERLGYREAINKKQSSDKTMNELRGFKKKRS